MSVAVDTRASDQLTELHRQTEVLVEKGYPDLANITAGAFRALVAPLEAHLPDDPFVLVVARALTAPERLIDRATLNGKRGFTTMEADDISRFTPTRDLDLPKSPIYLIVGVDTGKDLLNVRPDDALPRIHAADRTPLTLEEGLAVVTQHPEWLRERNCFEMLGSRAGDKRVTGIWVSRGAPRLGWCWGGNPHTWLGMASAGRRVG